MTLKTKIHLMLFAAMLVCSPLHASPSTPQDIYKEALLQETTVRNPEVAVTLYQQVVSHPTADRALRAQAYLRLGLCQRVLGKSREASAAWETVIHDYSDQKEEHRDAVMHQQALVMEERPVERVVVVSTPIVKTVYAIPPTRWELRLPGVGYSSVDGVVFSYPTLSYFYKPHRAWGLEGGRVEERTVVKSERFVNDPFNRGLTANFRTSYIAVVHRWEKSVGNQIHPYLKAGPALYLAHASDNYFGETIHPDGTPGSNGGQSVTKYSPGLASEAGLTIGWSRGFVFTAGYGFNVFYQPSFDGIVDSSVRGVGTARFALGYRW